MFGLNDTQKSEAARILNELLPKKLHISFFEVKKDNWTSYSDVVFFFWVFIITTLLTTILYLAD